MYNRLDSIPACDRRTDVLPRHSPRYAYVSRGKNGGFEGEAVKIRCSDPQKALPCVNTRLLVYRMC